MKVVINITDNKKGKTLIEFLKELPFVNLDKVDDDKKLNNNGKIDGFYELFGIWKNRKITKESLRESAWR